MASRYRTLVIGGGIGGLAAALALRNAGLEVTVLERAPQLAEVGAGITLWSNAVHVLRSWNVADRICAGAFTIERGEFRSSSGRVLVVTRVGEVSRKLGAPCVGLHRAELQQRLFRELGDGVLRLNSNCVRIEQDATGVSAYLANGEVERADVLVGADGLRSTVREMLFGGETPRYSGYACYRGMAPISGVAMPPGYAFESWGPGRRFGAIRLDALRVYWFATLSAPAGSHDTDPLRTLCKEFEQWHQPIAEILRATPEGPILRHDVYDRKPRRQWGTGRVTLLGDAAHAMTPDLGQGACQAIEDAFVLARQLAGTDDPVPALRAYEHERYKRVSGLVKRSRLQGWIGQQKSAFACGIRNLMMQWTPAVIMQRAYEMNVDFEL